MKPLLHIGYHKTGTTWLQRSVFPLETTGFRLVARVDTLDPAFVRVNPFLFDAADTRKRFGPEIVQAQSEGLVPALSYESLSGMPHYGGREAKAIADRLHATFSDGRVLIVIREQKTMILSSYKTYVRMGGPASLQQYLPAEEGIDSPLLFHLDFLDYNNLVSYYQDLFGAENVLVLPYELLKERPWKFVRHVCKFAGATLEKLPRVYPVNASPSAFTLSIKQHVNKWLVSSRYSPAPVSPIHIPNLPLRQFTGKFDNRLPESLRKLREDRWHQYIEERIGDRYAKSNAITAELTSLDLQAFGYDCQR